MKYKPIRVIQLYGATKKAAKQKYSGETFIFNDLVNQVGTFNCTTNEIREVGRMFGAWKEKDATLLSREFLTNLLSCIKEFDF